MQSARKQPSKPKTNAKSAASVTETVKAANQRKKVLSLAEKKRQEQQRIEAGKSKAEKLAESLKRKNILLGKHPTVADKVDGIKQRTKRPTSMKVNPVKKTKRQNPIRRDDYITEFNERIRLREEFNHRLLKQAEAIRHRYERESKRQKTKLYESLRDCYGIFEAVENSTDPDSFYAHIRSYLLCTEHKLQSNSTDEGLLVRFTFGKLSSKQISEYGTILRHARTTKISKDNFVEWLNKSTMTGALQSARSDVSNNRNERLDRARILLMKLFDLREEWPLGYFDYPEHLAAKQVHLPDDLMFVIARGVRNFERDIPSTLDGMKGHSTAKIAALHFIPPNVDLAIEMLDRLAKFVEPHLEQYEEELLEVQQSKWGDDLTHLLMERELGDSYKSADRWANRMQAAMAHDQVEFERKRRAIQKMRNKSRNTKS